MPLYSRHTTEAHTLRFQRAFDYGVGALSLVLLFWTSRFNYLLFHTLAELYSIITAACVFFITSLLSG